LSAETGIDQSTLYRQPSDDVLTLMECVRERNDRADEWTDLHELLAQVVDAIQVMRMEAYILKGVPRSKLPKPPRVQRPWEIPPEVPVLTPSQFARLSVVG
jgi:hypothetical protein